MQVDFIDYKAALETLDHSRGTREDLTTVSRKLRESPADVTDADLVVYGFWHGEKSAAEARSRRDVARTPQADAHRIHQQVESTPATVTDEELVVYKFWYGDAKAALARTRRDAALKAPPVQKQNKRIRASQQYATAEEWTAALMDAYDRVHVKKEQPTARDRELLCEPVSYGEIAAVMKVVDTLNDFVLDSNEKNKERNEQIAELKSDNAELRAEIAELKAAPKGLAYCGTWQRAAKYSRHQGVTHKGHTWVVVVGETYVEPGTGGDWQLAQKGDAR